MSVPFKIRLRSFREARQPEKLCITAEESSNEEKHWRKKMKGKNPKEYKAYKKHEALAARVRRLEESMKLHVPKNKEMLAKHRAVKAQQMREYRRKKKQEREQKQESPQIYDKCRARASRGATKEQEKQRNKWSDFVAVKFSPSVEQDAVQIVYMATVLNKVQDGNFILKFMRKASGPNFLWPEHHRLYTHPFQDIVCKVAHPEITISQRAEVYRFTEEDLAKIKQAASGNIIIK